MKRNETIVGPFPVIVQAKMTKQNKRESYCSKLQRNEMIVGPFLVLVQSRMIIQIKENFMVLKRKQMK